MSEVELFLLRHWDGTPEDLAACVSVLQEEARRPLETLADRLADVLTRTSIALHQWHDQTPRTGPMTVADMASAASRCQQASCREVRGVLREHMDAALAAGSGR